MDLLIYWPLQTQSTPFLELTRVAICKLIFFGFDQIDSFNRCEGQRTLYHLLMLILANRDSKSVQEYSSRYALAFADGLIDCLAFRYFSSCCHFQPRWRHKYAYGTSITWNILCERGWLLVAEAHIKTARHREQSWRHCFAGPIRSLLLWLWRGQRDDQL